MKFEVLKPFTWAGQDLETGDSLEIPDESSKIGPLSRSKFIRLWVERPVVKASDLPALDQVVKEVSDRETVPGKPDPKEVVRAAKAKAAGKK